MLYHHPTTLFLVFLKFLQQTVDAATLNGKLTCGTQAFPGPLQMEGKTIEMMKETTFLPFPKDLCEIETSSLNSNEQTIWFCDDCLRRCPSKVDNAPTGFLIVADTDAPNKKVSWFKIPSMSAVSQPARNSQCNWAPDQASNPEDNTTDALRSFSKTSVLFVSISFIILMVISLAWLVFYYVQRFRYAHAKDRLQRRLFNAARKALARIPTRAVRAGEEELQTDCAVCLDPYQLHDIVRILPCKHVYHKSCIDPWLLEHRTCPMCKADILKYFGYQYYDSQCGRTDDLAGRVELGERERDRALTNEIVSPEVNSDSSESAGFSFDHSEHVENFTFIPTVAPQLVLNASNAKSFVSGRVGSASSVGAGTSNSGSNHVQPTSYSARTHRSSSHDRNIPQRVIRTSHGGSVASTSSGSQGQIVNLVQVKSRSTSVTRAATIRKESLPQPTPVDVSSDRPTTSTTQAI